MKRDRKKPIARPKKLTLAKDTVRRLADSELSHVPGGAQTNHCETITGKCCLTR
jgi:hypothetical protein